MIRGLPIALSLLSVLPPATPAGAGTPELRVFHVATALDPGDGSGAAPTDYYLDGGTAAGVTAGMRLQVYRTVQTADALHGRSHETRLHIGELQVLEVFADTAIAQVAAIVEAFAAPAFEPRAVMIGDRAVPVLTGSSAPRGETPATLPVPGAQASAADAQIGAPGVESDLPRQPQVPGAARVHGGFGDESVTIHPIAATDSPIPPFPSSGTWYRLPPPVLFALNSADLDRDARFGLEGLAQVLAEHPERLLMLEGRTCDLGSSAYNRALSLRRARNVAAFLQSRGVAHERLTVLGHGEHRPVRHNDSEDARRHNRRVDLRLGTQGPEPEPEIPGLPPLPADSR